MKLKLDRSRCPIANSLALLGDKWTLLIVRDLLLGKRRYKEFQESAEKIPSNILASRLKKLEQAKLVNKVQYQEHPPRYEYKPLTRCAELAPLLQEFVRWGGNHIDKSKKASDS